MADILIVTTSARMGRAAERRIRAGESIPITRDRPIDLLAYARLRLGAGPPRSDQAELLPRTEGRVRRQLVLSRSCVDSAEEGERLNALRRDIRAYPATARPEKSGFEPLLARTDDYPALHLGDERRAAAEIGDERSSPPPRNATESESAQGPRLRSRRRRRSIRRRAMIHGGGTCQ
jgi:hypothetical protein